MLAYKDVYEIIHSNSDFEWLLDRDYRIVAPEDLPAVCEKLMSHDGVIAFDTETTGLGINFLGIDKVVGLVFSIQEGQAWYVPLRHNVVTNVCAESDIPAMMEQWFKPILQTKDIVMFNASFDMKVMEAFGIFCKLKNDVKLTFHLTLDHTDPLKAASLKKLTDKYLNRRSLELEMFLPDELQGKRNAWKLANFADLPYESVRLYACADTDNTLALQNYFDQNGVVAEYGAAQTLQIENSFSKVVAYSEYYGIHYDKEGLPQISQDIENDWVENEAKLFEIVGYKFNPNSTKQLAQALFNDLGYPVNTYTDKGAPSTATKVIETLAKEGEKYPAAVPVLELKKLATLKRNFLKPLSTHGIEGYTFPSVNPLLETGRCSTSDPNIQGTPSYVKNHFKSREDFYTVNFDFSSIEYRLLACMAGEPALIEFFHDPTKDYHRKQASVIFQVPYGDVTPEMRKIAKPFNFALPYGKGDRAFGYDLFGSYSPEATAKAADLRARYFAGQPRVEEFFEVAKQEVTAFQFVKTFFGRRRYFDYTAMGLGDAQRGYNKALRASGNHKIQGTAADLYKLGMIRLYQEILNRGWYGKVLFSAMVHDETNLEVHNSIHPAEILEVIRNTVMINIPGWCPLYIGAGYGDSWGQAKSQDLSEGTQQLIVTEGKNYPWDGDIQKWYEYTEQLRTKYMTAMVDNYLANYTGSETFDPDIAEYAKLVGRDISEFTGVTPEPKEEAPDERTVYMGNLVADEGNPHEALNEIGSFLYYFEDTDTWELFVLYHDKVADYVAQHLVPGGSDGAIQIGFTNPANLDECYHEEYWVSQTSLDSLRKLCYKARTHG